MPVLRAVALACALLVAPAAVTQISGESLDTSAPISIEADSAEQDEKTGVTTYKGNVAIVQGSLSIAADLVRIVSRQVDDSRIIAMISAEGSPARFNHRAENVTDSITANARSIDYMLEDGKVILQREAALVQHGSSVSGDRIEYFIAEKRVSARTEESASRGGRVRTVITPGSGILFDANE
ncbi:MAG: lipopolysaccharide transport periplasmic protein LptA [Pseudomonadales bacterium]